MIKRISKRSVESKIKKAFYNAADDIGENALNSAMLSLSDAPGIGKEKVRAMTGRKTHTSIFKIVAIAATLILILSITVTATGLSGLSSKDDAISAAINYMIINETDAAQKDALSNALFFGNVYLDGISDGTAKIGLSEGRLVYYVSFYAVGYKYNCIVDAKTLVVFDGDKSYEPDYVPKNKWTPKRNNPVSDSKNQRFDNHKINRQSAQNIFTSNFGLYQELIVNKDDRSDRGVVITETEDGGYYANRRCDGYSYSCNIDSETGEVSNANVAAIENYKGEAVLHEKIEGLMTIEEAAQFAVEISNAEKIKDFHTPYLAIFDGSYLYYCTTVTTDGLECDVTFDGMTGEVIINFEHISNEAADKLATEAIGKEKIETGKVMRNSYGCAKDSEENVTGVDEYHVEFVHDVFGTQYLVILDAHTGEVLKIVSYDIPAETDATADSKEDLKALPDGAEGAIPKSEAIAIALEYSGLTISNTFDAPEAILVDKDGVMTYIVEWETFWRNHFEDIASGTTIFRCEIDAVSGEVITSTPEVIRQDIEAESEKGSYIGKKAAEDALIEDLMISKDSLKIISIEIEEYCASSTKETVELRAAYAISFDRNRLDSDHEEAYIDALSGEVVAYRVWVAAR